jgi:hypothetical protein
MEVNWSNLSANLVNLPINTIAIDSVTGIEYVGTDVGVYYRDISTSPFWQTYMNGLPNVIVNELEIHYASKAIRAATYGRGIWEADLIRPSLTSVSNIKKSENSNYLIYPNPNSGTFALRDELQKAKNITIFNDLGQVVLQEDVVSSSVHEFDLSHLNEGLYILRIAASDGSLSNLKFQLQ